MLPDCNYRDSGASWFLCPINPFYKDENACELFLVFDRSLIRLNFKSLGYGKIFWLIFPLSLYSLCALNYFQHIWIQLQLNKTTTKIAVKPINAYKLLAHSPITIKYFWRIF